MRVSPLALATWPTIQGLLCECPQPGALRIEYERLDPSHFVSGRALKLSTEMVSYVNNDIDMCVLFPTQNDRMTELSILSPALRSQAVPPNSLTVNRCRPFA